MHLLGHRCELGQPQLAALAYAALTPGVVLLMQVIYAMGVNEQLLGDFVRKHSVRDKLFSKP